MTDEGPVARNRAARAPWLVQAGRQVVTGLVGTVMVRR
jgi:hypothetical protein